MANSFHYSKGEQSTKRLKQCYWLDKKVTLCIFFGLGVFGLPDYPATDFVLISPSKLPYKQAAHLNFLKDCGISIRYIMSRVTAIAIQWREG